ncbi:GltB/FmdC/FwdC-like GXGXG domain-containing protein [Nguyenibacter vanlangensis]|uniref:Protein glxC n=1 Tax=Nguyenibacter vanlangensis TaxID=1216886 RepID=A0A7Y7M3G7_9PROT|nr:protein glxC [Nguyenibacter vanlangensis]NVN09685.1 protein glxC [Nguyenibacter vanlangensis]
MISASTREDTTIIDLAVQPLREVNALLQAGRRGSQHPYRLKNPRGQHAIAVGLDAPVHVTIEGNVGYYAAGMNKAATVIVEGNAGPGVAENMMSGRVHVKGNASMAAGATARGGFLLIDGDAGARCGISMKGVDIVVRGNVGHMSAFMAQSGALVVCGDAGEAFGDSLYEARLFVRGTVTNLGADCERKDMTHEDRVRLEGLLTAAGIADMSAEDFTLYGSARRLYHFHVDHANVY